MRPPFQRWDARGFTLIELLLTLTIILLLISMLLPALNRGHSKIKSLQCRSNLHQTGIAMVFFANSHEDKYPIQVSTNQGGSLEFLASGQAVQGEFYFSYRHFLPLASELQNPKLLVCPADLRSPATNFADLRNTNLSYFVAANPVFMKSDSILAGDRNLYPVSNSMARLSQYQPLRWTAEMHQNRGNVLYADAHVEQVNGVLSLSNSPGSQPVGLVMPSTMNPLSTPAAAPGFGGVEMGGGGGASFGGNLSVSSSSSNAVGFTNSVVTNLTITSGPRHTPPSLYLKGGPGGEPPLPVPEFPDREPQEHGVSAPATRQTAASSAPESPPPESPVISVAKKATQSGWRTISGLPWWFLAALVLLALWLLKRARQNRPRREPAKERPWVYEGRR